MSWIGIKTLYIKEVRRFIKVYNQTILAPIINSVLFLLVFNIALKNKTSISAEISYAEFISAGLIIMTATQGSFANTSSTIIQAKILGTIRDYLVPPFKNWELIAANIAAAVTRSFIVTILAVICMASLTGIKIYSISIALIYLTLASILTALLGMISSFLSNSFDQAAVLNNYVISPLTFLSGTFYSVHDLPNFWYKISQINPFFYFIDGFRFSLTGYRESNLYVGIISLCIVNILLWIIAHIILASGYKIKT
jgi:ABC-2 type transport system permease protein